MSTIFSTLRFSVSGATYTIVSGSDGMTFDLLSGSLYATGLKAGGHGNNGALIVENASAFAGTVSSNLLGAARAFELPNKDGTFAMLSDIQDRPWAVKTTTYTAVAGDAIQADTSGAAWTLTLPASAAVGDFIEVQDAALTWGTNALTIARNGLKINSGTTNYTANATGGKLSLVYVSTAIGWRIS